MQQELEVAVVVVAVVAVVVKCGPREREERRMWRRCHPLKRSKPSSDHNVDLFLPALLSTDLSTLEMLRDTMPTLCLNSSV